MIGAFQLRASIPAQRRPTTSLDNTSLYVHEHQELIKGESSTALNRLTIRFRDAILDAVDLWKMTGS